MGQGYGIVNGLPDARAGVNCLGGILHQQLFSENDLVQLARSLKTMPPPGSAERTPFMDALVECCLSAVLYKGTAEETIDLLAQHCPEWWYPNAVTAIEVGVWFVGGKEKEPIRILTRAYKRSNVPTAKRHILAALGRALPLLKQQYGESPRFVEACETWIAKNRDRVSINPEYLACYSSTRAPWGAGTRIQIPTDGMSLYLIAEPTTKPEAR